MVAVILDASKRLLFITGDPNIGKTTIIMKTVEGLKARGYRVGGMISHEARTHSVRVGFEILDLDSNRRGWLALVNQNHGPKVGKYRVNLEDLDNVGVASITRAVEDSEVIVIDEVGPMELHSEKFKDAVRKAAGTGKLVIGVIHRSSRDALIEELKGREDFELIKVTEANRDSLPANLIQKSMVFLGGNRKL